MRGLFIVWATCRAKGTQGRRGISCPIPDQVDQGPFRGLQDPVDLRLGMSAIRSPCLVPVVLLLGAQAQ